MDNPTLHLRWLLEVPESSEEALADWLTAQGSTATYREADPPHTFFAYFPPGLEAPASEGLAAFAGVRLLQAESFLDEDWLAKSREGFGPIEVGRGFYIQPLWEAAGAPAGRTPIIVNPGLAFGTGGPETTRLCRGLLEDLGSRGALLDPVETMLNHLFLQLALGLPLAVIIITTGGYWLVRRALTPVEQITRAARNTLSCSRYPGSISSTTAPGGMSDSTSVIASATAGSNGSPGWITTFSNPRFFKISSIWERIR